ncbi:hypothetical protein PscP89CL_04375 [Pseudomonas syringae]|uniref:hypothetical protein n=1 Tax=Pseudomonas syringae TaxID=317 RepID=UPI00137248C5|nr:hypothetical protein [Pseudomonas syringae]NAQ13510.1 hypothetical protein [Pseudomonas syringae]
MTVQKDNHIDPELKARWGFGGEAGKITVGPETVGETGGVDHARTRIEESGGRNSGGGVDDSEALRTQVLDMQGQLTQAQADLAAARASTADPRDDLTIVQLKEQLDAKAVAYKANDSKAELLALLKGAQ